MTAGDANRREHRVIPINSKENDMAAVEEKVKQIIVEQLGVDEGEVTPNASFVDDLGADSLDTVELVMAFEEAFEIEIPDEDAEKIRTVQDAIRLHRKARERREVVGTKGRSHWHRPDLWSGQHHGRGLEESACGKKWSCTDFTI